MTDMISLEDEEALEELRRSLLRTRAPALGPDQGNEAFQQHKLLASAVQRTSRLDARKSDSETDAWVRYITGYFPAGRNDPADARLLFAEWRTRLLKDDAPGPAVPITHGQSVPHWQRDEIGRLCINLEDMWHDFEQSVDNFINYLRTTPDRRAVALERWRDTAWEITPFTPTVAARAGATVISASASVGPVDPAQQK